MQFEIETYIESGIKKVFICTCDGATGATYLASTPKAVCDALEFYLENYYSEESLWKKEDCNQKEDC